jgi:ethanolamine utilization protein EutQ (cupin superfamily)
MEYRIDFEMIPWVSPMKGVRHKLVKEGPRLLRLAEYSKELEPHWCERGHIGWILEGQLEVRFNDDVLVFNPGDGVFIPAGREHRHMGRALSDVVRVVFVEDV